MTSTHENQTAMPPGQDMSPANASPLADQTGWASLMADAQRRVEACCEAGFTGIMRTPLVHAGGLSRLAGCEIWVKLETLQATGSFKERGALARLSLLDGEERRRGVAAASAGNHAQGVARHATALGIDAVIFMPESTPNVKVNRTRELGARVELAGTDFDETSEIAQAWCREQGRSFIHPFDDADVIAGQGTIATEMLADHPGLDVLVMPVGGGGLAAGMGLAARRRQPGIELIGVQSELFPAAHDNFHGVATRGEGASLAEGISVRRPGSLSQQVLNALLDDVCLVDERQIERALNLFLTDMKVLAEGAGAAGLAAVLADPERFRGKQVGLVLTGGNIDTRLLSSLLLRDLARSHRLARLRIELLDVPGQLSRVSDLIAREGGNVTDVAYHRTFSDLPAKLTYIDISLEAQDSAHMNRVYAKLGEAGFKVVFADY